MNAAEEKYLSAYEQHRLLLINPLIPAGEGRAALDLGCGAGWYSRMLAAKGWKVTAVDKEVEQVTSAQRFAHRAMAMDVLSAVEALSENSFDLILALELVEHLTAEDGQLLLRKLHDLFPGKFIASTPNRYSPEGLGGYYWGEKIRGWEKWNAWDPTHVKIYGSFEWLRVLRQCGWRIEQVIGYWYAGPLPFGISWRLPFKSARHWPWNRLGFNIITACTPAAVGVEK